MTDDKCPKCQSNNIRKKGFRQTKNRGKQQRLICNRCGHSFTINTGFWKMKNSDKRIVQAIETYFEGLSLRKVKRNFERYAETQISHQTVLNWIRKYSFIIRENVKKLQPQLSGHYLTDETFIKCGGQMHNLGLVMDKETRYAIATLYREREGITPDDNIKLWKEARDIQRPHKFTSDAHQTYKPAFRKVFYTRYKEGRVDWEVINHLKTGRYNYTMERLWNTLKERIKITRGFKAAWSAKLIIDGFFIWYNFIRPHMSIGKTPAEKAKIENVTWNKLISYC